MKQHDFTKEEMSYVIDRFKDMCSNAGLIKEHFLAGECIFWDDNHNVCIPERSCVECTEFKL